MEPWGMGYFFAMSLVIVMLYHAYHAELRWFADEDAKTECIAMHAAWTCLDPNDTGAIHGDTLKKLLREYKQSYTVFEVDIMTKIIDRDSNNVIDESEFQAIVEVVQLKFEIKDPSQQRAISTPMHSRLHSTKRSGTYDEEESVTAKVWWKYLMVVVMIIDCLALLFYH